MGGRGQSCREYNANWKNVKTVFLGGQEKNCAHKAGPQWKKDQVMRLSKQNKMQSVGTPNWEIESGPALQHFMVQELAAASAAKLSVDMETDTAARAAVMA